MMIRPLTYTSPINRAANHLPQTPAGYKAWCRVFSSNSAIAGPFFPKGDGFDLHVGTTLPTWGQHTENCNTVKLSLETRAAGR